MLERHPDIAQAAVVPIDDEIKGQKPVAFVVPKPGRSPSEDEIKRFALANAPAYAHPRFVWFTEELPLASTNKVDRGVLHRLAEERLAGRMLSNVDLPEPDGPRMATTPPMRTSKLTSRRTSRRPPSAAEKCLETS